jgi:hypothetical protein
MLRTATVTAAAFAVAIAVAACGGSSSPNNSNNSNNSGNELRVSQCMRAHDVLPELPGPPSSGGMHSAGNGNTVTVSPERAVSASG